MLEKEESQEETINIKSLILNYLQYWYYFILAILAFLFISFLNNRYTIPEYSVSSTLLIRDDNNTQMGAENILEGLELFSGKSNIENEIVILNSYNISEKVVKELNLGTSYFEHGLFISNELYKTSPIKVVVDSSHLQLTGVSFQIEIIDSSKFRLIAKAPNQYAYNITKEEEERSTSINVDIDNIFSFDSKIKTSFLSFTIFKTDLFNLKEITEKNKTYSFIFHKLYNITNHIIKQVTINPINIETSVLRLNIKDRAPKKNIAILNKLTEIYILYGLYEKNLMAINTIQFIDNQLNNIQDSLVYIENQLQEFRKLNPNIDIADEDYGTYFQKQKLDNTLSEQSVNIKYYESLLSYLKNENNANSIVSPTSMGISNPELNNLINQLLQLFAKKGDLQLTTTEKNPTYQAVLSQIDHTKNTIIENVRNLISSASIYEKDLKDRITTFNSKINKLPEAEKNYLILKRRHEYNEQTAIYLQQKRYEASLAKAGTESDHKIIDMARLDSHIPIKPRKRLSYFIALLFGFIMPIICIYLRDFFSDTISSKSDLENATRIPILGLIGHSDQATNLVVPTSSKSVISESFRALRTNIQYLSSEKEKKVITITSSIGGEGKTFITINLACIFALAGNKTILVGGDLRKPRLHTNFNIDSSKGLSNYLINKAPLSQSIQKTHIESLDILPSGPNPPNPAELLDSTKMQELIKKLNKTYDYVIIDTPPIGLVTDGVILMRYTDINLYIVRHNFSRIKTLNIINNLNNQEQIKNLNIIINDFKNTGTGYGYGYGYAGYGYYDNNDSSS